MAFRLVAVLLSLEFSGIAHAAVDGVEALTDVEQHESDDCDGEGCHECSPGCPNCHCWHAGLPSVPAAPPTRTQAASSVCSQGGFFPYTTMPPRGADPDSVYRPPRLTPAHH